MSEYWVSHKKFFCKYCNIYIADDVPSRRQHETGLRHKGNVERFVRGLYKEGERRKHDQEEEKREMARVEQAAQAAYARDVGAGLVKPGSSSTSDAARPAPAPKKPVTKPANPYANYTTAASLGITDPDEERRNAEAERRRTQGVAGDWEVVAVADPTALVKQEVARPEAVAPEPGPSAGVKREAEAIPYEEDTRTFKLRRRTAGVGLGEIYDPGLIPIKVKKQEPASEDVPGTSLEDGGSAASSWSAVPDGGAATERPTWSARGWNRPGESRIQEPGTPDAGHGPSATIEPTVSRDESIKHEEIEPPSTVPGTDATDDVAVKVEVELKDPPVPVEANGAATVPPAGGSMFRKRKMPAGGAGSRGRRP